MKKPTPCSFFFSSCSRQGHHHNSAYSGRTSYLIIIWAATVNTFQTVALHNLSSILNAWSLHQKITDHLSSLEQNVLIHILTSFTFKRHCFTFTVFCPLSVCHRVISCTPKEQKTNTQDNLRELRSTTTGNLSNYIGKSCNISPNPPQWSSIKVQPQWYQ